MPDLTLDDAMSTPGGPQNAETCFDLVLVVGTSRINHVVVGRIAERAGLKALADTPDAAGLLIERHRPGIVVLDAGPDGSDCDGVMETLATQRRGSDAGFPIVVMLSGTSAKLKTVPEGGIVDAMVPKPITPDRLQPLFIELLEQRRH